jgi:hypothetical protein
MDPLDQRDQLLERAKVGEITGDEADAEAIRLGLGSLSHTPAPGEFRPESEPYWTVPMAVAWIVYLDLDEVREWFAPFREACSYWHWRRWRHGLDGEVTEGWLLESRSRPTLTLLEMGVLWDDRPSDKPLHMSVGEARKALWQMLREGFIVASGIDMETGRRVEIAPLDWNELISVQGPREIDEVRRGLLGSGYREVLLPSAPLRNYWRRVEKPALVLPATMAPNGYGYMPLYCAAQWIATEGGKRDFDPADVERWRLAYRALTDAISGEAIRAVGITASETKPVPPHLFAAVRVNYPFEDMGIDMMVSSELVLRSYPYVDEEHWLKGFDDALVNRRGDLWTRLMVDKSDVRTLWPFAAEEPLRTGAPGRPTSRHLILAELERRALAGIMDAKVGAEARALAAWLKETHPQYPPTTASTAENIIRDRHKVLKATK